MNAADFFDAGLAGLVLAVAAFAVLSRNNYAAVVAFVAYGLLVSLRWVLLRAVDVALTEAAIGSGLTGVLLLSAAAKLRERAGGANEQDARRCPPGTRLVAAVVAMVVTVGLGAAVIGLPDPSPTLAPLAAAALPDTGLGNAVTATLIAYRATDTLLEKVVLVLALLGLWSLAAEDVWCGRPGLKQRADPDGVLAYLARRLVPVGVLIGLYVFWVGADHPGGAFQGATIVAAMWLLAMMAGLADTPPVANRSIRLVLAGGALLFFAVGLAGLALGDAFLAYPVTHAKAIIIAIEVAMTITVAVTLALLIAGTPERPA
jgi:multisubunit Na+/H+ antiporter MnhB subunit